MRRLRAILRYLIEDLIRWPSGPLGVHLRRAYYRRRFAACGSHLTIDSGVHISGADQISAGDWVMIDKHCILAAGVAADTSHVRSLRKDDCAVRAGELRIGSDCHMAVGTIVQAHGGVSIGSRFTSSAGVKIYSLSNAPYEGRDGHVARPGKTVHRIETPVVIGDNVWLGLNVMVVGGRIGGDSFVKPGSLVTGEVADNSVVSGNPATVQRLRYAAGANAAEPLTVELS